MCYRWGGFVESVGVVAGVGLYICVCCLLFYTTMICFFAFGRGIWVMVMGIWGYKSC